jgi:hypothetical protein
MDTPSCSANIEPAAIVITVVATVIVDASISGHSLATEC